MWARLALLLLLTSPVWAKPTAEQLCGQAAALTQQHKMDAALDKYREAIRLDPGYAKAYVGRGRLFAVACADERDSSKAAVLARAAFEDLDQAIQLDAKNADAFYERGFLNLNRKKYTLALTDLDRSLALAPQGRAYVARGLCHARLNQDRKAVEDYTQGYRLTQKPECIFSRGNCYRRLEDQEKAMADYRLVIQKSKDQEVVGYARKALREMQKEKLMLGKDEGLATSKAAYQAFEKAEEALKAGHHQEAIRFYNQALKIDPKFAKAAVYKGDAYLGLGEEDKAMACYRQGIQLDPQDKQAHRFLGKVLERKWERTRQRKLLEEAIQCYQTALKIDPDYGFAQESLKQARESLKEAK